MIRSSKVNRQIKRNITGLLEQQKPESTNSAADAVFHILAAFTAVLLPLSAVAISGYIAFRLLDLLAVEDEIQPVVIRGVFENIFYPAAGFFTLSIILFVFVRAMGRRRYLRVAMNTSLAIYLCAICFMLALALYPPFREAVFAGQPGTAPPDEGGLPEVFGGMYPIFSAGALCLISFIIYITLYSVLKRFTQEEEKMFK